MNAVTVLGVGFVAPGAVGWDNGRDCLAGVRPYSPATLPALAPGRLPANERRRQSATMRLALVAAEEAVAAAGAAPASLASVFASAAGDGGIIHSLCMELSEPRPALSPTRFHNSVHNAPAGYWSIAAKSHQPSTALAAHDATFAAGLIEAVTLAHEGAAGVLLIAYDHPLPFPLDALRPIAWPFACALVLARTAKRRTPAITLTGDQDDAETVLEDRNFEALRLANPAARSLPFLARLARAEAGRVALPYLDGATVTVDIDC